MATCDSSKMNELDMELDKRALKALKLMNELIASKLELEKSVKAGSLDLAKARYIMGNRNVSALQLPTPGEGADVAPLVTVHRAQTFQDSNNDSSMENTISLQLERVTLTTPSPDERARRSSQAALKKRTTEGRDADEQRPLLDEDDDEDKSVSSPRPDQAIQDPIKWFGVLVPQNLRQGQARFKQALDLVVHTANIQLELHATVTQFRKLLDTKRSMQSNLIQLDTEQPVVA
ncbi:coiled-coil domain-containing protein 115 isoform X2 [Nilaparvata lugens]|nr:coiled-coil domain-containing protein 115 isoform X2 [Nilaparvata lugens]